MTVRSLVAMFVLVASATLAAQAPLTPTLDALIKEIAALRAAIATTPTPTPTPPPVSGPVVTTSAGLQPALDAALAGATVYLAPGVTYTTNVVFRKRGAVTLTTQGFAVPAGTRVGPAQAPTMAKIVCLDCFMPTIGFEYGAHDVSVVGVEVIGNPSHPERATINIGNHPTTWAPAPTVADQPARITFDRVYVHAAEATGGRQGILTDGATIKVINSYISGFWFVGQDSQAVGMIQGVGPVLIENNYLEASGENILVGGSDPVIPGLIPADITVRRNMLFKPLAWKAAHLGSVKNLFELKNAQRVLIERNVFENVWVDGQPGSAILFTVRNQDGACPQCVVKDVTFRCNEVRNVANFAVNLLGRDDANPSGTASNIVIANNLMTASNGLLLAGGATGVVITTNVLLGTTGRFLALDAPPMTGFQFTGNRVQPGEYGITGDGSTGLGTPTLTTFTPGGIFTGNTIETTPARTIPYPAGNTLVAPGTVTAAQWAVCP